MSRVGLAGAALFAACATTGAPQPIETVVVAQNDAVPQAGPASPPGAPRVAEPAPVEEWPPLVGASSSCAQCLPTATEACGGKRDACLASAECVAYLECTRACPPPSTLDADGGYPQADCVIACREQHASGADLGDAHLWCVCCDSPCKASCGDECSHFKSGIAGPIGAGCD